MEDSAVNINTTNSSAVVEIPETLEADSFTAATSSTTNATATSAGTSTATATPVSGHPSADVSSLTFADIKPILDLCGPKDHDKIKGLIADLTHRYGGSEWLNKGLGGFGNHPIIHEAILCRNDTLVSVLLDTDGIDVNRKDKFNRTPLIACGDSSYWKAGERPNKIMRIFKLLFSDAHVDTNAVDRDNKTAIECALCHWNCDHYDFMEYIAETGKEVVWGKGDSGEYRYPELMTFLAEAQAAHKSATLKRKASEIDSDGEDSPAKKAAKDKRAVFEQLRLSPDPAEIKKLLAERINDCGVEWFNTGDDVFDNRGILHEAVMYHNQELIKVLLQTEGIDVNRKDAHGLTPFLFACHCGDMPVVKLLLNNPGVDINVLDRQQGTTGIEHIVGYWDIFEYNFLEYVANSGKEIVWSEKFIKCDRFDEHRKMYKKFAEEVPASTATATTATTSATTTTVAAADLETADVPQRIKDLTNMPEKDYSEMMFAHFKADKLKELAESGWTGTDLPKKDVNGRYPQLNCVECAMFFNVDYDKLGLTSDDIDDSPAGYFTNVWGAKNRIICDQCLAEEKRLAEDE